MAAQLVHFTQLTRLQRLTVECPLHDSLLGPFGVLDYWVGDESDFGDEPAPAEVQALRPHTWYRRLHLQTTPAAEVSIMVVPCYVWMSCTSQSEFASPACAV